MIRNRFGRRLQLLKEAVLVVLVLGVYLPLSLLGLFVFLFGVLAVVLGSVSPGVSIGGLFSTFVFTFESMVHIDIPIVVYGVSVVAYLPMLAFALFEMATSDRDSGSSGGGGNEDSWDLQPECGAK